MSKLILRGGLRVQFCKETLLSNGTSLIETPKTREACYLAIQLFDLKEIKP